MFKKTRSTHALLKLCAAAILSAIPVQAAVEAHVVRLSNSSGSYSPPSGKVFIVEQIGFSDHWDPGTQTRHVLWYSNSTGGSFWRMTQNFGTTFNHLLRPVRLAAPSRVAVNSNVPVGYQAFLFGVLVDEQDLYAARIPSQIHSVASTPTPGGMQVNGNVALASPRPAKVTVETSTDLDQWQARPDATIAATDSKSEKTLQVEVTGVEAKTTGFVRVDARARHKDVLPPFPFQFFIPLPN